MVHDAGAPVREVFDLPCIFPNRATLHPVMDVAVGRSLLARLDPKGITGKKFWVGLPSEVRARPERAMAVATAHEPRTPQQENYDAYVAVRKAGATEVHVLPLKQRLARHGILQPVRRQFEPIIGRDLLEGVCRTAEAVGQEGGGR